MIILKAFAIIIVLLSIFAAALRPDLEEWIFNYLTSYPDIFMMMDAWEGVLVIVGGLFIIALTATALYAGLKGGDLNARKRVKDHFRKILILMVLTVASFAIYVALLETSSAMSLFVIEELRGFDTSEELGAVGETWVDLHDPVESENIEKVSFDEVDGPSAQRDRFEYENAIVPETPGEEAYAVYEFEESRDRIVPFGNINPALDDLYFYVPEEDMNLTSSGSSRWGLDYQEVEIHFGEDATEDTAAYGFETDPRSDANYLFKFERQHEETEEEEEIEDIGLSDVLRGGISSAISSAFKSLLLDGLFVAGLVYLGITLALLEVILLAGVVLFPIGLVLKAIPHRLTKSLADALINVTLVAIFLPFINTLFLLVYEIPELGVLTLLVVPWTMAIINYSFISKHMMGTIGRGLSAAKRPGREGKRLHSGYRREKRRKAAKQSSGTNSKFKTLKNGKNK